MPFVATGLLFLGAMIMAVGLVAAAFYALRRKHDPILVYFAFFAGLYGLRMWIKADLISLTMRGWPLFPRFRSAIDFVVPIPAFLFFNAAGLTQRWFKTATYVLGVVVGVFALATLAIGPQSILYQITGVLIIGALFVLVARSARRSAADQDFVVIRRGLLIFVAFAVWENIRGVLGLRLPNVEPIGFVALLVALGAEALSALLRQTSGIAPADAADRIISMQQWAASQDDDLTVLVCDYLGNRALSVNS